MKRPDRLVSIFSLRLCICSLGIFFLTLSCKNNVSGNDDTNGDVVNVMFPPAAGTEWIYRVNFDEAGTINFEAPTHVIGPDSQTFPGETYTRLEIGDLSVLPANGFFAWVDLSTLHRVVFKASEVYYNFGAQKRAAFEQTRLNYSHSVVLDEPLAIDFSGDAGTVVSDTSTGNLLFDGGTDVENATIILTTTVVSRNASVTVPYGTVNGCVLMTVDTHEVYDSHTQDSHVSIWFSDALGLVKSTMLPGFSGIEMISTSLD